MELYLQMGHGMQNLCLDLIKHWHKGNIILSPVNISPANIKQLSQTYRKYGGDVLFDPQLFYPKDGADKLKLYDYWPEADKTISDTSTRQKICRDILAINHDIESSTIIIPSIEMDIDQYEYSLSWIRESSYYFRDRTPKPLLATLCLYPEILRSSHGVEELLDQISNINVDGYYIVPHSSKDSYIVDDDMWMIGLTKLITCLKLLNKKVIVGYSSHQGLLYALSKVDGIASGNYMNTRHFLPERFRSKKGDEELRKSVWYYHPYAISEYKAEILDIAKTRGYLKTFEPMGDFLNPFSSMLFSGATPSSTNYNETNSFKHYLHCLKSQCEMLSLTSFDETCNQYSLMLDTAEKLMQDYKKRGIRNPNRDFGLGIEPCRIAANAVIEDYGFRLKLDWDEM